MKLFEDLLVNSHNGNYNEICQIILDFLAENTDADVIVQKIDDNKNNIIVVFGKPEILINCHMDTVPPSGVWKYSPYILTETKDKYYGLGTTDTKGNIYAILKSLKYVKPKNLMILFSVDEESGGIESGVTHFLKSDYSQNIKSAIICEPTNGNEIEKHKGYYSYILKFKTSAGHSSSLVSKNNAIVEASKILPNLSDIGFNIAKISGGERGNIIPSLCDIMISIRSYENSEAVYKLLKNNLPDNNVEIIPKTSLPALIASDKQNCDSVNFWTEASLFSQVGIKSKVIGVGSIKQAHKEDEFVEKNEIDKMLKYFKKLFKEI